MKYQYIIIALLSVLLTFAVEYSGFFHFVEMKALDVRYQLRSELLHQDRVSKEIVVIGIDDDSTAQIKQPYILWDTFFAEIIESLGKNQAKIIALDYIWAKQIDDFVSRSNKERNALKRALLIAKNKYKAEIVMAIGAKTRQKSGSDILEIDTSLPMKKFGPIVGRHGFGVVNTLPDEDNYIRKIRLQYESEDKKRNSLPSFANVVSALYKDRDPLNSDEDIFINYHLETQFTVYPFNEVLKQSRAENQAYFKEHFKDKIVLMGLTNVSGDIVPSPISQETPGVMIHAHSIDMLINDNFLNQIPEYWLILLNILLSVGIIYYSSKFGLKVSVALTLLLLLAYSVSNILLFNINIFLPYITTALLIIWSFSITYLYRFVSEERSKRRLAKFFSSYVNEQVVKEILKSDNPPALEGKREKICILFSDIRSFTTYSENLPPEEVVRALNEYFSAMTEVILANNGTVDKFIGDGLMAFFGAPVHIDNPTLSAIKASLQMRQKLISLNEKWQKEGRAQLDNGIGLHTGYALVGNIGSKQKLDYTAIGDSVNTASRVEGVTKNLSAPILMTDAAYKEVGDQVVCEAKGEVPLKGRAGIFVYEVKTIRNNES